MRISPNRHQITSLSRLITCSLQVDPDHAWRSQVGTFHRGGAAPGSVASSSLEMDLSSDDMDCCAVLSGLLNPGDVNLPRNNPYVSLPPLQGSEAALPCKETLLTDSPPVRSAHFIAAQMPRGSARASSTRTICSKGRSTSATGRRSQESRVPPKC